MNGRWWRIFIMLSGFTVGFLCGRFRVHVQAEARGYGEFTQEGFMWIDGIHK